MVTNNNLTNIDLHTYLNLDTLDISGSLIKSFPGGTLLPNLEKLIATNCSQLTELDTSLLPKLNTLIIGNCLFTQTPSWRL